MTPAEAAAFESLEHFEAACRLRRYDDEAKDPEAVSPPLERYEPLLRAAVAGGPGG
jgi:gamma-butyrobetaine dioxygenase